METTSAISKGVAIRFKDGIFIITNFQHVKPGKGGAFVRTKLKNVKTGSVLDHTFRAGEAIETVELERTKMQYLYQDVSGFHFMDPASYEQVRMASSEVGELAPYLQEGSDITLLLHEGKPVTIELPKKMTFTVKSAPPGVKGDTASGRVTKEAILENGLKIQVPLFVEEGDKIVMNTETGEYVERA